MGLRKEPPEPPDLEVANEILTTVSPNEVKPADVEGSPDEWLLGMTPDVAEVTLKKFGFGFRIYKRQGCTCMVTADYRMMRYNVGVDENNVIIEVLGRG